MEVVKYFFVCFAAHYKTSFVFSKVKVISHTTCLCSIFKRVQDFKNNYGKWHYHLTK